MRSITSTRPRVRRLALAGALSATLAAASVTGIGIASAATAHPAAKTATTAFVVKERSRAHFGKILVTERGMALYYKPHGSCTGQCLAIWPRLVMPKGKTKPRGANCLGTKTFGNHRLQVTYRGHRLYTFVDDMGTSVTGNNVQGFKVAKVVRSC
jgi:predicted lipoprotein with Yx(FWY)xxD motif